MTKRISLEEALELFDFEYIEGEWRVKQVKPNVRGDGQINVWGTINGRKWEFIEKPERLLDATGDKMLIEVFNQLVESNAPHHHTGGKLMTDQHPLTDEICDGLVSFFLESEYDYVEMRAAADWQLEQVLKWLNETIFERGSSFEAVNIPEELEEAMRPTTTQEDN